MTEFASFSVWTAVVVDIGEVKADEPHAGAKDPHRLLDEKFVADVFEFVRWEGVKLSERVVVGVRSMSGVGDGFDRLLIDSSLASVCQMTPESKPVLRLQGLGSPRGIQA
ncbi:hypothetical protein [Halorubellus litoreus]|uniref:Transposase n=1 Tax=Halorubellus litoreus TaxID=755308 RepID=A0ABD5VD85_9EURY